MKTASAVIGAGYGDEGKGLMTDYFARFLADVVVRTNGGAQAGHTVALPDGRRHVFHHVASGALAGVPSHLGSRFVSNPMFLVPELGALAGFGAETSISADPRGYVTTPYDVMVNQIVEEARGGSRHGSCGMGFGETIERNEEGGPRLTVGDLYSGSHEVAATLRSIRTDWVRGRLDRLGMPNVSEEWEHLLSSGEVEARFIEDCIAFCDAVRLLRDADVPSRVLFEGAQGLMLDMDYGHFPHVTRSNTGLLNMAAFAREAGIAKIDAVYATRIYATRHGAGPLEHEEVSLEGVVKADSTNVHNSWQGLQRVAPLDVSLVAAAVRYDLARADGVTVDASLALTCIDQADGAFTVVDDGAPTLTDADLLANALERTSGCRVAFRSTGPTAADVLD